MHNNRNISAVVASGGGAFHEIVSLANLHAAWKEFRREKRKKRDVFLFEKQLEDNLLRLHKELSTNTYRHGPYTDFYVNDPKRRHIHKATVRDRVVHQALFRVLYPLFDKHFIYDSYSSRTTKGTHKGFERMHSACRAKTKNWTRSAYALKCDVRKFFDSIDHTILRQLLQKRITDTDTMLLVDRLFASFEKSPEKGLALGNVTSQLFANVYLNELDQYAKHTLKARHYFRYSDDFIIVDSKKEILEYALVAIQTFLKEKLMVDVHPTKVEIRKVSQGTDFLGYVSLPHSVVLRTKTRKRILKKVSEINAVSYMGVLSHCRNRKLRSHVESFLPKNPPGKT